MRSGNIIARCLRPLTRVLCVVITVTSAAQAAQSRIDLAGRWQRLLGGELHDTIVVPSSYRPIGTATLTRSFELPPIERRRVLLKFEGITYRGEVRINGAKVGSMGPWTPYSFDITEQAHPGANQIEVDISDSQVALGPTGGWESYGGIIRAVFIELRPDPYIAAAQLQYKLSPDFASANCSLAVQLASRVSAHTRITARLLQGSAVVAEQRVENDLKAGAGEVKLTWNMSSPALWTPDNPNLYTLRITLTSPSGEDEFTTETGFRQVEVQGNRFLLNGRELILRGVCRHDIWFNQGHTLTDAQIEQDLRMIKALGANFVRLVHYPHDPRVVRAAARIGLFFTEESGLVWLQFRTVDRAAVETGIENLERTIRRDWNNPALFAVLVANESAVTPEVMREAKRRVNALLPRLLVSSARVDSPDRTLEGSKKLFDEGGLDFYAYHPYTFDMDDFEKVASTFTGKPLVFTEWGGRSVGDSPVMMKASTQEIGQLIEAGRVAGHSFWSWSDLPEFSREGDEMEDGILVSGVVTEQRIPRPGVYTSLAELFLRMPGSKKQPERTAEFLPATFTPLSDRSTFKPISLQGSVDDPAQKAAWSEMEATIQAFWKTQGFTAKHWAETGEHFWTWDDTHPVIGKLPFATALRDGHTEPVVLTAGRDRVSIPVGVQADRLLFLGNVTVPDGYPVTGAFGAVVGRYTIVYADGEKQPVDLRWGYEMARANMIYLASRIDPATAKGERVMRFVKDPVREVYQTRLFSIRTKPKVIERVEYVRVASPENGPTPPRSMHHTPGPTPGPDKQALLLFAVTAETDGR